MVSPWIHLGQKMDISPKTVYKYISKNAISPPLLQIPFTSGSITLELDVIEKCAIDICKECEEVNKMDYRFVIVAALHHE